MFFGPDFMWLAAPVVMLIPLMMSCKNKENAGCQPVFLLENCKKEKQHVGKNSRKN